MFDSLPALGLPKGGGAIRGIGEKVGVNQATGTASLSIPLPFSPARGGAAPDLSLTYDSGAGAGISDWKLRLPQKVRHYNYRAISDAILTIRYTSRNGGEAFGTQVSNKIVQALDELNRLKGMPMAPINWSVCATTFRTPGTAFRREKAWRSASPPTFCRTPCDPG